MKKSDVEINLKGALTIMNSFGIKPNYSALSRKYNLDRHTIKKYHMQNGKVKKKTIMKKSMFDDYLEEIIALLSKPEITIKACCMYLNNKYPERNIWNYSSFNSYVSRKGLKLQSNKATPHVRYETMQGEQLQVDWKESLSITSRKGEVFNFNIFSATLSYSRFHQFIYSRNRTTEDFIRCTIDVLKNLGGIPKKILTDNMSTIVSIKNGQKRKHNSILQFEKDLGVKIDLCKIKTPETKGKVESSNRFVNWLNAYNGEFDSETELINIIRIINNQANAENNQTTNLPPIVLFTKEKEYLRPLPNKVLIDSYVNNTIEQVVPQTLLVTYNGSSYSVPKSYINKRVKLVAINQELYIYYNTELIIIHDINNKKFNYDMNHYSDALSSRIKDTSIDIDKIASNNLRLMDSFNVKTGKFQNKYGILDNRGNKLHYIDELSIIGKYNPTAEELYDLGKWVKKDNTFCSNPYGIFEDDGKEMNFIEAVRLMNEMEEEYEQQLQQAN